MYACLGSHHSMIGVLLLIGSFMAKLGLRAAVLKLRAEGKSYSQIRAQVPVSKSTLSTWLRGMPLSKEQINELRGRNPQRIERYRATRLKARADRHAQVFKRMSKRVGKLSKREKYLCGLYLYWAEGTKAARDMVMFTNTDPAMILFCLEWFKLLGIQKERIKVYLHLYSDMDVKKETQFWSNTLGLKSEAFRKPYIKLSTRTKVNSYKGRFSHGTCNLYVGSRDAYEEVMLGLKYIRSMNNGIAFPMTQAL